MEVAFQKKAFPCMTSIVREVQNSEQTQELRLPDGMPDIDKVLCAWGQVILRSKEWRSDSILVSGGMLVWVLYQPEDGSGPRILDGWLPFQMRWTLPDNCREGTIRVNALTRFVDARSVSPRKLMLRAGIGILMEAWAPQELEICMPEGTPENIELLKRRWPVRLPREAGEKTFAMEEEVNPGIKVEKLLYFTLRPEITEQKVVANKIAFRGCGNLHAVWMGEDGGINNQDFALPFSQFAELAGSYSGDAQTDVSCCVTNLEVDVDADGILQVKCAITAQYLADDLEVLETVEDAYSPGISLRMEKQLLEVPALLEKRVESADAECTVPANAATVVDISFLPDFPHQFREGDSVAVEIPGTVQLLYYENEGSLRAVSSRWEGKLMWPLGENTALRAVPMPAAQPQFSIGGENVTVHAELPMQMVTMGGAGIPMVTELEPGVQTQPDPQRPSLILRRAGTDSLWDIAKKCGSTVAAIRAANGLQEEPRPGQMLLIPVQ